MHDACSIGGYTHKATVNAGVADDSHPTHGSRVTAAGGAGDWVCDCHVTTIKCNVMQSDHVLVTPCNGHNKNVSMWPWTIMWLSYDIMWPLCHHLIMWPLCHHMTMWLSCDHHVTIMWLMAMWPPLMYVCTQYSNQRPHPALVRGCKTVHTYTHTSGLKTPHQQWSGPQHVPEADTHPLQTLQEGEGSDATHRPSGETNSAKVHSYSHIHSVDPHMYTHMCTVDSIVNICSEIGERSFEHISHVVLVLSYRIWPPLK